MPTTSNSRVRKRLRRKLTRAEVLRILKMDQPKNETANPENPDYNSEFYNTGRVGRRNALPDILGHHSTTTTADLPARLNALSTTDDTVTPATTDPGPSGVNYQTSKTSTSNSSNQTPSNSNDS